MLHRQLRKLLVCLRFRSNYLNGAINKVQKKVPILTIISETADRNKTLVYQNDSTAAFPTSKMASSYIEM